MYPQNDNQFEEVKITRVDASGDAGWQITRDDGWCFYIKSAYGVEPKIGDSVRFYGGGIGAPVRGAFINGQKLFYATEDEHRENSMNEIYGANAAEWLARFDGGKTVWSVTMGGFGPGYEQAIQLATTEIVRMLLETERDLTDMLGIEDFNRQMFQAIDSNKKIGKLGLSGNQVGAAYRLARSICRDGPRKVVASAERERQIQFSKHFPSFD